MTIGTRPLRTRSVIESSPDNAGIAGVLLAAAVGLGIALRLVDYLRGVSFNIDEARIALNVGMRSYLQLLPPLDHDQSAPLLFLWAEKSAAQLLGMSELALRSIPLLAGIATVVLLVPVSRRILGAPAAVLAVALAAAAPGLVQYSSTLKQYAVEAFTTVVLLRLYLDWSAAPESRRARLALGAGGGLAVWAAAPAVFVLAGVWLGVFVTSARAGLRWRYLGVASWIWGLSFAAAYVLVYRDAASNPYMQRFWAPAFLDLGNVASLRNAGISVRSLVWAGQMETLPFIPRTPLAWVGFHGLALVLVGLLLLGLRRLTRRNGTAIGLVISMPLLLVVLTALLALYPIVRRTTLFMLPLVLLAIAAGIDGVMQRLPERLRAVGWLVAGTIVLGPNLAVAALMALNYNPAYHLRPLVAELEARRLPGEPLYVSAGALPAWTFYSTDWTAPDSARVRLLNRIASPSGPAFENAPSRRRPLLRYEGVGLKYETVRGEEILGLPSGIEAGALVGPLGDVTPDSGWAAHEAGRIRAVAQPAVWVMMSQHRDIEMELLGQVERLGGRRTFMRNPNGVVLARYEFGDEHGIVR